MIEDQLNIKNNLINKVLNNDESFLKMLYKEWRGDFTGWFQNKFQLNETESSELYQDTFLHLFMNIREGKVLQIDHPKTYLYGIGKNLMRQQFKTKSRQIDSLEDLEIEDQDHFLHIREQTEEKQEIVSVLASFGEPCRSLLMMFYFDKFSHEVIAERLGYKNGQVVKKKKSLCMSDLRKKMD